MDTVKTTLPYHKDFNIYQGASWSAYLVCKDANGTAKNITGYTAVMQIRKKRGGDLLIELDEVDGIDITGASGQIAFSLTAAQTAGLKVKTAEYDLFVTGGGETTCLLEGTITIKQSVTEE